MASGVDPSEKSHQVRDGLVRFHAEVLKSHAQLLSDLAGLVVIRHPASVAQDLDERKIRDIRAVGEAVAFEIGDAFATDCLTEFMQQTRFTDARLSAYAHYLAVAPPRRGET
jgi:isoaspartyl peptidase/L-asparaginase-like protein (Ntn-hydrolase superfamily)